MQQHSGRRFVDVLRCRDKPNAGLGEGEVDLDVVGSVAGKPVDLVDDAEGYRLDLDELQHAFEFWANNPGHALGATVAIAGTSVIPGGGLLKGGSAAAKAGELAGAQPLLTSIGIEGKTAGVLISDDALTPLLSGRSELSNYAASGHVEGQAALIMREQGLSDGVLLIDNPNGICAYCVAQVPTLLPEGATLTVQVPSGTVTPQRWFTSCSAQGRCLIWLL